MQLRRDGPFQVLARINDNAYKVDLLGEYNVCTSFNVSSLSPFDYTGNDLRSNPFEDNDGNQGLLHISSASITRSKIKKLKEPLNGLIQ